jgi:hypothetical protein
MKTVFDINIWVNFALYMRSFAPSDYNRAIRSKDLWNNNSVSVVHAALEGKYGTLAAHSHIWNTVEYVLVNEEPKLDPGFAKHLVKLCKEVVKLTNGEPVSDCNLVRKDIDDFRWKNFLTDHEDATVAYGALAINATHIVTHDWEFSMCEVPGISIWYQDNLTAEQRRRVEREKAERNRHKPKVLPYRPINSK